MSAVAASPSCPTTSQPDADVSQDRAYPPAHEYVGNLVLALSFPDYYGRNLNAFDDCMRDVVTQDFGWAPDTTGLALAFTGYDAFAPLTACLGPESSRAGIPVQS